MAASSTPGSISASDPDLATPPDSGSGEPADAKHALLTKMILDAGGLGAYPGPDGSITIVIPVDRMGAFSIADAATLGFNVRLQSSSLNRDRVEQIKGRVRELAADHPSETGEFGMYFDPRQGDVVVEGPAGRDAFDALLAEFPDDLAHRQVDGGRASRHSDYPPFYGGSEAGLLGSGFECSTGFTVRTPGNNYRYMLTAGHCFDYYSVVYSAGSGERIGRVTKRPSWPQRDMEAMGGRSYDPYIYRGGMGGGYASGVRGAANFEMGFANYCRSGAASGEACHFYVLDLTADMCWAGFCTSNVVSLTGGECAADLDSGGPWFQPVVGSSDVYIKGLHIGQFCSVNYAEKWPVIRTTLGVEIVSN